MVSQRNFHDVLSRPQMSSLSFCALQTYKRRLPLLQKMLYHPKTLILIVSSRCHQAIPKPPRNQPTTPQLTKLTTVPSLWQLPAYLNAT